MKILKLVFILLSSALLEVKTQSSPKRVVCYVRPDRIAIDKISSSICTHYIYTFIGANSTGGVIFLQPTLDNSPGNQITKFKNLKTSKSLIKLLPSFGGNVTILEQLAQNFNLLNTFASNVLQFLKTNNFDGIDINWQYSTLEDTNILILLLTALRNQLNPNGKLLTISVIPDESSASQLYEIPEIVPQVDFINLLIWNYTGSFDPITNYDVTLFPIYNDFSDVNNIATFVNYWLSSGASKNMLNIIISLTGQTWTLEDSNDNEVGAAASGPGVIGSISQKPGILNYNEICQGIKSKKYTAKYDPLRSATYAHGGNQWIAYRDPQAVDAIVSYVIVNDLGGVGFYSLDQEDYSKLCSTVGFSLVSKAYTTLVQSTCGKNGICNKVGFQNIGTYAGNDYNGVAYKKSFYLSLHTSLTSWYDAASICLSFNMTLATFKTAQEYQSVQTYLFNYWSLIVSDYVHIGGKTNTLQSATDWYWIDSYAPISFPLTWFPDDPDNWDGNEWCLCLAYSDSMLYADIDCYLEKDFLCQKVY